MVTLTPSESRCAISCQYHVLVNIVCVGHLHSCHDMRHLNFPFECYTYGVIESEAANSPTKMKKHFTRES
jgi:hypothetical protein